MHCSFIAAYGGMLSGCLGFPLCSQIISVVSLHLGLPNFSARGFHFMEVSFNCSVLDCFD
uniref:Uncharacterized protein n=1 Tax=Nelumbo nucifera TaxID=4432 RepID=A0A822XGR7_NELNU|nr:TPA_asm: hypothetical protein HUJ06_020326 [Nelumbo nucifera]